METINKALPEIVNDYFDEFGEIVSETVTTSLRDMVNAPEKLRLVRLRKDLSEIYISAFPADIRQEYNCRTCFKFLNGIGSLAIISVDGKFVPLAFNEDLLDVVPTTFKPAFEAVCKVFNDALATDFEVVTTDMFNRVEVGFIGEYERGGYHHFAVDGNEFNFVATCNILMKHSVDLSTRDNGVGKAEATAIHEYLQTLIEHDIAGLVSQSKLRERDLSVLNEIVDLVEEYKNGNRALVVLKHLIDKGTRILNLRNSVVGTLVADVVAGVSFEDALERYLKFIDPRYYKRPTRLPTEGQFEESVKFLTEKGWDKFLPQRFSAFDEVTETLDWVKPLPVKEEKASTDVFASAREKISPQAKEVTANLVEVPLEAISLRTIESLLKEYIEAGTLVSLEVVARQAFIGAFTTSQDEGAGEIFRDGKLVRKFFGSTPLPLALDTPFYKIENLMIDGLSLERDDFNNPMITMVKKDAAWKQEMQMTVFPDDLIDELRDHHRVIEHWSRSTKMNTDEDGNVIVYETVPLAIALSVGHGLRITTKTEKLSFEISSLR